MTLTLNAVNQFFCTMPGLVTKCSVVQKILSGQTFTNILNLHCDLDLEHSNPFFPQDTDFWRCTIKLNLVTNKPSYSLTVALTHKTQKTNFYTWHSGLWCHITIPGLVTKCSVVEKISSGQTVTNILNLHYDLDLECNNNFFPQDTLASNAVLSNQVCLQMDQ